MCMACCLHGKQLCAPVVHLLVQMPNPLHPLLHWHPFLHCFKTMAQLCSGSLGFAVSFVLGTLHALDGDFVWSSCLVLCLFASPRPGWVEWFEPILAKLFCCGLTHLSLHLGRFQATPNPMTLILSHSLPFFWARSNSCF